MKFRNTLIYSLLFILLIIYVYLTEFYNLNERRSSEALKSKLLPYNKESVFWIKVKNEFGQYYLQKIENDWKIIDPVKTDVDKETIEKLLLNFFQATRIRTVTDSASDLSVYGLSPPNTEFIFGLQNETSDTLLLGDKTPSELYRFARLASNSEVVLTNYALTSHANISLFGFRDKKILNFNYRTVAKFELNYRGKPSIICEKDNDQWRLSKPLKWIGDDDNINRFLDEIEQSTVDEFVEETSVNIDRYGFNDPEASIRLHFNDQPDSETILIGKQTNKLNFHYAKIASRRSVFVIDNSTYDLFIRDLFYFRNKIVTDQIDMEAINAIDIVKGETRYSFQKIKNDGTKVGEIPQWKMKNPVKGHVKDKAIDVLLKTIINLRTEKFIDNPKRDSVYGFDNPDLTVKIRDDRGNSYHFVIGDNIKKDRPEKYLKNMAVENSIFIVSPGFYNKFYISNPEEYLTTGS